MASSTPRLLENQSYMASTKSQNTQAMKGKHTGVVV